MRHSPVAESVLAGRRAVAEVTERDREVARRLPDEFLKLSGTPAGRINKLVRRYWPQAAAPAWAELTQALLLVLRPLLAPGAGVTDQKRLTCEDIVASWLGRQ